MYYIKHKTLLGVPPPFKLLIQKINFWLRRGRAFHSHQASFYAFSGGRSSLVSGVKTACCPLQSLTQGIHQLWSQNLNQFKFRVAILMLLSCASCHSESQNSFRVMFYNVENLFDCEHDDGKNDNEFLPGNERNWNTYRYNQKLTNIAKVITAVGGWTTPALVGLCEVENDKVVTDLISQSPLKNQGYRYVITNSPDERGIDVALLYQRDIFKLLQTNPIRIHYRNNKTTRDILHVSGKVQSGDTLDIFVCHFPSRSGGEKSTEGARNFVAKFLKYSVDSVISLRKKPNILIMGDFNDFPDNASIYHVLKARSFTSSIESSSSLYNLFYQFMENKKGSYKHQGNWNMLDQIIVSGELLNQKNKLHIKENSAQIFSPDFLLEKDKSAGGKKPFRTYLGPRYIGGYSDHLPVYIDIIY